VFSVQLIGRLLWRTDQETAAVVNPAGDERLDESSGRVVVERASDAAQLSKLITRDLDYSSVYRY